MEIDFVLPWVDGADPAWQQQKRRYTPDLAQDAREVRYRDWGTLRYWFRGVEAFAPWVRRVHFITWGHLPAWLNTEEPRLHVVRHEDYIPGEYLPTFSSHPIELNIHRIEGLAERFVYFNDDIFLTGPVREEDFFRGGLPCDTRRFTVTRARVVDDVFAHVTLNGTGLINRYIGRRGCPREAMRKWLSPRNGLKNVAPTLLLSLWPYFTGFSCTHLAVPFEKRSFEQVWAAEPVQVGRQYWLSGCARCKSPIKLWYKPRIISRGSKRRDRRRMCWNSFGMQANASGWLQGWKYRSWRIPKE